jgi:hypothetical protein
MIAKIEENWNSTFSLSLPLNYKWEAFLDKNSVYEETASLNGVERFSSCVGVSLGTERKGNIF